VSGQHGRAQQPLDSQRSSASNQPCNSATPDADCSRRSTTNVQQPTGQQRPPTSHAIHPQIVQSNNAGTTQHWWATLHGSTTPTSRGVQQHNSSAVATCNLHTQVQHKYNSTTGTTCISPAHGRPRGLRPSNGLTKARNRCQLAPYSHAQVNRHGPACQMAAQRPIQGVSWGLHGQPPTPWYKTGLHNPINTTNSNEHQIPSRSFITLQHPRTAAHPSRAHESTASVARLHKEATVKASVGHSAACIVVVVVVQVPFGNQFSPNQAATFPASIFRVPPAKYRLRWSNGPLLLLINHPMNHPCWPTSQAAMQPGKPGSHASWIAGRQCPTGSS
jgi:hypothetical protein